LCRILRFHLAALDREQRDAGEDLGCVFDFWLVGEGLLRGARHFVPSFFRCVE
jgi:hypothetical protein